MSRWLFALFILSAPIQSAGLQDNVDATLSRAQSLYYEAKFRESIQLLLPLDSELQSKPDRLNDRINVLLQIALGHIGLGETTEARNRFSEIAALNPNYSLGSERFAQKVILLFEEAKAEQNKARCQKVCTEANKLLDVGDAEALLAVTQSANAECVCLEATARDAASYFYQRGVEAYKREDFITALQDLRVAAKFDAEHELAGPYIELIQNQLRLAAERIFLQWREHLDARAFGLADQDYRRLESANIEGAASQMLEQVRAGYREQLAPLIESWNHACSIRDSLTMNRVRNEAKELLPDPAIGQDLLAQTTTCAQQPCADMTPEVAMTHLIRRDNPEAPAGLVTSSVQVQVRIRIDENGSVSVIDPNTIDPFFRTAASAAATTWKFTPTVIDGKALCVDTEIPIVFKK